MRKMLVLAFVALCFIITGCATSMPMGEFYTELKLPIAATGEAAKNNKVGVAECTSILGLVATGDASIDTAMKNGGITKVSHIDWQAKNILGIIGTYKVIVYGQ
jgi:hypothetical protein